LDRLLARQRLPESLPLERSLAHHVERPPGLSQPAHAVVDAPWTEPDLRDVKALAALAHDGVLGDAHVLVDDLRVAVSEALVLAGQGGEISEPLRARGFDGR